MSGSASGEYADNPASQEAVLAVLGPELYEAAKQLGAALFSTQMQNVGDAGVGEVLSPNDAQGRVRATIGAILLGMREVGSFGLLSTDYQRAFRKLAGENIRDPKDSVGVEIDDLRRSMNVTQQTIAEHTLTNTATLSRFFSGSRHPQYRDALLPVLQFLWEHRKGPFSDPEEVKLLIERYVKEVYKFGKQRNKDDATKAELIARDNRNVYAKFLRDVGLEKLD